MHSVESQALKESYVRQINFNLQKRKQVFSHIRNGSVEGSKDGG